MSWNVHLWCNQCGEGGTMLGTIDNVTAMPRVGGTESTLFTVGEIMRVHEVEKHGGKP
jgi:hypothetical protein